jgi:predicted DNA-binding transcriptional regulator
MLEDALKNLDLSDRELQAYLALVRQQSIRPTELAQRLSLPRTTVQNILLRLEQRGLAMKVKEGKVQHFCAQHPENLLNLLEMERLQALSKYEHSAEELRRVMPQILGMMHSAKSLPQVRFFRGSQGCREVLFDTLNSRTELKDFANIDAMFAVFKDINDAYVAAREQSKVTKRSLLLETPFAHQVYESGLYSPKSHKGYKWIPAELYPFTIEMNIYDGRVSYLTYVREEMIGVIIENPHIYQMHDSMWNLLWDLLPAPQGRRPKRKEKKR